ncbi:hypothetical protein [Streptomyces sp. ME19-01-6]|uniref:hypothetical protein n=1 Tax=Streptomyces sp. ME19-01-6 TaxID=3028686 RepID=UPI0029BA6815|nr:hypothetical protein [Streptomyces sp. ME19-01-6]MDX3232862.1 hypothetical protein [Streptomyces sp. ME19-01-6]
MKDRTRTRSVTTGDRPRLAAIAHPLLRPTPDADPIQPDEFLRRARLADAAKRADAPAGAPARMSPREQTIALCDKLTAFAAAGLQHVDPGLLAPVAAISLHDPETGDFIGGVQLPEELADTLYLALEALRRAQEDAEPAEHSRTADSVPARPALRALPGGAA